MDEKLLELFDTAAWIGSSLFMRNKTSGSSANMSFLARDGTLFITGSGTCFGKLTVDSFARIGQDGTLRNAVKPSKELPLHQSLYRSAPGLQAVIHTHGPYAVLWSCLEGLDADDAVPVYTPYLRMKLGKIALVPFAPPGSQALFEAFAMRADDRPGYLLAHHGAVVGGATLMDSFYRLEELEESCRIAWEIRGRQENIKLLG
jgi:ribulose-5-phosphate 4-epimerase/fuculose-1-phosphate aldolase